MLDATNSTEEILARIVELIHAAMERRDGPTVGYGVGQSKNKVTGK